jgi:signal transduction histidine kinase
MSETQFQTMLGEQTDPDSIFIIHLEYANQQLRRSPAKVKELAEMLNSNPDLPELNREAYSNYLNGMYFERPEPDSAFYYYGVAQLQFESLNYPEFVAKSILRKARMASVSSRHMEAEDLYFELLEYLENNDASPMTEAQVLNELTDLYIRVGATELAVNQLNQMLEIGVESPRDRCRVMLKMSNAYKRNREIDLAVESLLECAEEPQIDEQLQGVIYRSLSDMEKARDNQEQRLIWIQKANALNTGNINRDFLTLLFLGETQFELKNYEEVESVLEKLQTANLQRLPAPMRVQYYMLSANFSIAMKSYDQAMVEADKGLQIANRLPQGLLSAELNRLKAQALEAKGEFQQAYLLLKEVEQTERLIEQAGRIQMEATNKVRFQMRDKNAQVKALNSELAFVQFRTVVIILLLILLSGFMLYRYRLKSLLQEERTRTKIAHDLHDEVSATLTGITFFAEAVKKDKDDERKSHYLNLISESAGDAKDKITDIVWSINPKNDDWDLLLAKCRRYASDLFESKGISYQLDIDEHITGRLTMNTRQHIWMIYKEIVTNAARHGEATEVEVLIKEQNGKLKLRVSDNGIGFDTTQNYDGNGVANIKSRAEKLNTDLKLVSSSGSGTSWDLSIPLK